MTKVLERLLAKNPGDRYRDYSQLETDLRALAPVGVTKAGRLNRALAVTVDYSIQAALMGVVVVPAMIASSARNVDSSLKYLVDHGLALVGLLAVLVPVGMTLLEWQGWRTPGRYLFQLRVVDEHGLRLTRRKRWMRSLLRNAPIWALAITTVTYTLNLTLLNNLFVWADEVIFAVNALPIIGPMRRTLHDRLFGSHVVLDTTK